MSQFIVIEKHGGWEYATPVTDIDGNNIIFDTLEAAQKEADDCQDGIVVGRDIISDDALGLLKECKDFLTLTKNSGVYTGVTFTQEEEKYQQHKQEWLDNLLNKIELWQKSIQT